MAKIEAGRMQMEKTDFDLTDLSEKTISTFAIRAHGKGLELAARIEPGVPDHLTGDPLRCVKFSSIYWGTPLSLPRLDRLFSKSGKLLARKIRGL
jgi:signal transduction histidine kinase